MTCSILHFAPNLRLETSLSNFISTVAVPFLLDAYLGLMMTFSVQVSAWPGTAPGAPGGAPAVSGTQYSLPQQLSSLTCLRLAWASTRGRSTRRKLARSTFTVTRSNCRTSCCCHQVAILRYLFTFTNVINFTSPSWCSVESS